MAVDLVVNRSRHSCANGCATTCIVNKNLACRMHNIGRSCVNDCTIRIDLVNYSEHGDGLNHDLHEICNKINIFDNEKLHQK